MTSIDQQIIQLYWVSDQQNKYVPLNVLRDKKYMSLLIATHCEEENMPLNTS